MLPNGLRWVCWHDPSLPLTAVHVALQVGAAHERPGSTGMAHMLEHLMFRGTPSVPDGQFDRVMEDLGAQINAMTSHDGTVYTTTCPPDALPRVLALESDRMQHLAITSDVFATEREVVASERRQVVESEPEEVVEELLHAWALEGSRYAWPVIGWGRDIARWSRRGVAMFHRTHYRPASTLVVVVGPTRTDEVARQVEDAFGGWPQSALPVETPPGEGSVGGTPGLRHRRLAMRLPIWSLAFPSPSARSQATPVWWALEGVLSLGWSSRLVQRLEVELGCASDVSAHVMARRHDGLLTVRARPREGPRASARVQSEVLGVLEQLAARGPEGEELARVRLGLSVADRMELWHAESRADLLSEGWLVGDDPLWLLGMSDAVEDVSPQAVQSLAVALLEGPRWELRAEPGGER
jgi:zinc protease